MVLSIDMLAIYLLQAQPVSQYSSWGTLQWITLALCALLIYFAAKSVFKKDNRTASPKEISSPPPVQQRTNVSISDITQVRIQKLKELQKLKDAGILSDVEVEQEKRKILNKPS